jgi:XTP/dITP diphosphohydrolase
LRKLVLATTNQGKLQEIHAVLADLPLLIVGLADYPEIPAIAETGRTFRENAVIKAQTVAEHTKELTLADDSGLEVDALQGAPGIYSARYGQPDWNFRQKSKYLLAQLAACNSQLRSARFRCAVALCDPLGAQLEVAEGTVEGEIAEEPRGENGFGYDPIFYLPDFGLTMAELPESQKNRFSHRSRALAAIRPVLTSIIIGDRQ